MVLEVALQAGLDGGGNGNLERPTRLRLLDHEPVLGPLLNQLAADG
jgi:hypothetical protein